MLFNVAAIASLLAVASARITGIAVPETVAAGSPFNIVVETQNYIQTEYDVAFAVGYAVGQGFPQSLGAVIGSFYLGPSQSNIVTNITRSVTIPSGVPNGEALISASVMSLIGAVSEAVVSNYNVSVTIGDATSSTLKSSSF